MPRNPSHFGSYDNPPSTRSGSGMASVSLASIGSISVSTVRSCSARPINSTLVDSPAEPEPTDLVRLRLDIAYDGTGFQGWGKQPGLRSVTGELEKAVAMVFSPFGPGPILTVG